MTQFTKGQIVSVMHKGARVIGVVDAVGATLIGVRLGLDGKGSYETLSQDTARNATPSEKVGLKVGDKVTVGKGRLCISSFKEGSVAMFNRDDGSSQPRFIQNGETQYLDLTEITIGEPELTPAQRAGIKVGDQVELIGMMYSGYFGSNPVFLIRDDASIMPLFGDRKGQTLWLNLETDVRKLSDGPKAGVLWTDAPAGATHYSLRDDHGSKWHKQDALGNWYWAANDRDKHTNFHAYGVERLAYPATQKAIPGVTVEVTRAVGLLEAMKAIDTGISDKRRSISGLQSEVDALTESREDKLREIRELGYNVQDGKLAKIVPAAPRSPAPVVTARFKDGDVVRCIKTEGKGVANIVLGGRYRVVVNDGEVCVIDGDGDAMRGCVSNGCFVLDRSVLEDLSTVSVTAWRVGDTVQATEAGWDITEGNRYKITRVDGRYIGLMDDVDFPRRRPASEFKLVARA